MADALGGHRRNAEKGWAVNAIRFEGGDGRDRMRLTAVSVPAVETTKR